MNLVLALYIKRMYLPQVKRNCNIGIQVFSFSILIMEFDPKKLKN